MKKILKKITFFDDLFAQREGIISLGFWALQIYRFGHLRYRFKCKLIRWPLALIHIILAKIFSEMLFGITISVGAKIGKRLIIEHSGAIVIHGSAVLGDDCIIRQAVTIGNKNNDKPLEAPQIGDRVNIGAGAKILGAISIGNDVSIGANAVVLKNIPENSVAVGIPARIIKKYA